MNVKLNCLAILLMMNLQGFAQNSTLRIGQQLPDLEINKILYHTIGKTKLSDFKDKLIILDFWSMSCSSCIKGMPKMDSMQKYFGDKIAVLPVYVYTNKEYFTKEYEHTIDSFWHARPLLSKTALPSVLDNNFAYHFHFPINSPGRVSSYVGYQIWIDKDRIIRAITDAEYVNKREIQKMLDGIYPDWEIAPQNFYDYTVPLNNNPARGSSYSFFSKYLPKVQGGWILPPIIDSTKNTKRIIFVNTSIIWLYLNAIQDKMFLNRFLIETSDSSRYFINTYMNEWRRKNTYCYEIQKPITFSENEMYHEMLKDLNTNLQLNGRMEKREVNCYVIKKAEKKSNQEVFSTSTISKQGKGMYWYSLSEITDELNKIQRSNFQEGKQSYYFVNDVDKKDAAKFLLSSYLFDLKDIPLIRTELLKKGYDIQLERRQLDMFIISDKKQ